MTYIPPNILTTIHGNEIGLSATDKLIVNKKFAAVFDALQNALEAPDGSKVALRESHSVGGLGLLPLPGSGALTGDNTSGKLINTQIPAFAPFFGVKLVFLNYDTAGVMNIDGVKVAPAASCGNINGYRGAVADTGDPNNSALTFSAYVTFAGSQSVAVPQATTGPGGQVIPGVVVSDFVQVTSLARTDWPADPPVLRVATHITPSASSSTQPSYNGTSYTQLNTHVDNPGFRHGSNTATAALASITTSSLTYGMYGGVQNPVSAIFYYSTQVNEIFTFGDSLIQGTGSTSNYAGWPEQLVWKSYTNSKKFVTNNFGTSGQKTIDSLGVMKAVIAKRKPKYAAFKAWSPNDGDTQAIYDTAWGNCLDGIDFCLENDVIPIVLTSSPAGGSTWTRIAAQNARVLALPSSVVKIDVASILNTGGVLTPAYSSGDGTHWNDAGYKAVGNMVYDTLNL